jgi:hypothetical protein
MYSKYRHTRVRFPVQTAAEDGHLMLKGYLNSVSYCVSMVSVAFVQAGMFSNRNLLLTRTKTVSLSVQMTR